MKYAEVITLRSLPKAKIELVDEVLRQVFKSKTSRNTPDVAVERDDFQNNPVNAPGLTIRLLG